MPHRAGRHDMKNFAGSIGVGDHLGSPVQAMGAHHAPMVGRGADRIALKVSVLNELARGPIGILDNADVVNETLSAAKKTKDKLIVG